MRTWQEQIAPGNGLRVRFDRGAWAAAGQKEPWKWSWARAALQLALTGALLVAIVVFSFIYYVTPDVKQRSFRWITPGAAAGVAGWLLASYAFAEFLAGFSSFNVTYGSFAAAIILLIWLWLTNCAMLFGAELNAEIEREKELAEGIPEPATLALPPSDP